MRDYIEQHFRILAIVSLPQTAFSHYGAGVKPSILFLRKFSEEEYSLYQAHINRIKGENEAVFAPRIKELENERKSILDRGCPVQVAVTDLYHLRFQGILDNIDELDQRLGNKPTKKIQSLRDRFIRNTAPQTAPQFVPYDRRTERTQRNAARAQRKTYTADLDILEKEYREKFKAAADSEWESAVKAEYKEKIDAVKEQLADKTAEDIRQWIKDNANRPIFMAIAEHIGYDATGRKIGINDLDMIFDEYQKFMKNPSFFG